MTTMKNKEKRIIILCARKLEKIIFVLSKKLKQYVKNEKPS